MLLGGGGYHPPSTAKHFALLTALVLGETLDEDIPLDADYWDELERDGCIHVGKDCELTPNGITKVEELCTSLKQMMEEH